MEKDTGLWADYNFLEVDMRNRRSLILLTGVAVLALISSGYADLYYRMLLERAVFLMETKIRPEDAIPIFREIVKRHPNDRYYASRAQLYLGLCYQRMKSNEALQSFQDVIMNYPDQRDVVRIAEAELASLSKSQTPPPPELGEISPRRVWRGKSVYGTNSISHDGRYFSFVDQETGDLKLYDLARRDVRYLTQNGRNGTSDEYTQNAVISPDAKQIAYSWQNKKGNSELRIIGIDGSGNRILLSNEKIMNIRPAAWTADAGQILASLVRSDLTAQIVFISVSDGSVHAVKELGSQWPDPIKLSPDGRYAVYSLLQDHLHPERDIFLYNLEEKTVTPLVVQPGDDLLLDWTPDGKNIFYTSHQAGTTDAWMLAIRQGKPYQPASLIKSNIGQINPMGFTGNGAFYFEMKTGRVTDSGTGRDSSDVWAMEDFLPKEIKTLTIPDEYPTIQAGVLAAHPGDIVYVRKGVYPENVSISKSLTLQGEARQNTIIAGGGSGSVIHITASYVLVEGFTVTNGELGLDLSSDLPIHHITLKDLIVTLNTRNGIESHKSGGFHLIEDCIISKNREYGLNVHQFSRSIIRNCEVFGNNTGLRPAWGWHILVEGNKIFQNRGGGIYLDSCYYSTLERNLVYGNEAGGISVTYISSRNTIKENIVYGNRVGISFRLAWGGFGENRIYHNDLFHNQRQVAASKDSVNFQYWDNGHLLGGNYWSGYKGQDSDHDGIGDTPYPMVPGARDRYPLVKPRNRVQAALGLDPGWQRLENGKGEVTVHIELPAGLPPEDIETSSLLLNNTVSPIRARFSIGDYDDDGVADLTARFSVREAYRVLQPGENVELFISGSLKNGLRFEGRRPLKVVGR
jgi:parallel beta-helix repeat protein